VPVKGSIENFFKKKAFISTNAKTSQRTAVEEGSTMLAIRPKPTMQTSPPSRSRLMKSTNSKRECQATSYVGENMRRSKRKPNSQNDSDESHLDELLSMPALRLVPARDTPCHSSKASVHGMDTDHSTAHSFIRMHNGSITVKWTCRICTLENTKNVNKTDVYTCDACGDYFSRSQEDRSFDEMSIPDKRDNLAGRDASRDIGCRIDSQVEWSCAFCTLDNCQPRNKSGFNTCEACGAMHRTSIAPKIPQSTRGRKLLAAKVSLTPSTERRQSQSTTSTEMIILDVDGKNAPTNKDRKNVPSSEVIEIDLTDDEGDVTFAKRCDFDTVERADCQAATLKVSESAFTASFSVSKNSGRIFIHLGSRRESSGVNFDVDEVVSSDTADRLLDARTDRRSVSLIKPVAIEFNPAGVDKVLRSVLESCPLGGQARKDELTDLESRLKTFVSAYVRLREVEKKAVKDAGRPIEPSELAQHVASQLVLTATGADRYTGGAKEKARERVKNGVGTEGDAAILDGKGCAWCGASLHRSGIVAGSTYCSQECAEEGRLRRGGMNASVRLRSAVFALEGGRCTICGMDCHALFQQILALDPPQRLNKLLSANWRLPKSANGLESLLQNPREGDFWQVDHILAVSEGGGGCGLENLRTLCVPCHIAETEKLRARLRLAGPFRPDEEKRKQPSLHDFFGVPSEKARNN
jgi:HNH endonuclease